VPFVDLSLPLSNHRGETRLISAPPGFVSSWGDNTRHFPNNWLREDSNYAGRRVTPRFRNRH